MDMNGSLKNVKNVLLKYKLAGENDKILVAFSGGSDSVFLLYALKELSKEMGFSLSAAHLNHGIRDCADNEEEFASKICRQWGVEFFSKKINIPYEAKKNGISSETAGRNARYEFFYELREKYGFTKIATAHHMDDNAETILMHFIRGSGANGLKGIEYIRDNLIIRPLLKLSKQDIYNACEDLGLEYVTDSSNFEPVYTRNKVRLELIPKIMEINPNFSKTVTSNARLFAEDEAFINMYTKKIFEQNYNNGFPADIAQSLPKAIRGRIIRLMYENAAGRTLSQKYVDSAFCLKSGQSLSLPKNMTLYLSAGKYTVKKNCGSVFFEYEIVIGRELYVAENNEIWEIIPSKEKGMFYLPENVKLTVRNRKAGDRFYPVGMSGSKSVSDFFTDKKIPVYERDNIPILTADGEIVSIGGKYTDRRFCENKCYKLKIKSRSDEI